MSSSRFDLTKSIAAWRHSLEHNRAFKAEDLDELEQHMRDQVAGLAAEGLPEESAFQRALSEMGDYSTAESEYRKVYWGKLRRRRETLAEFSWRISMLKNYVTVALRNMWRQPGYTAINILGLAVGLACFILILLFVQHELSYDRFHEKAERTHRVVQRMPGNVYQGTDLFAVTPAILASTLLKEYPEVEAATVFRDREALVSSDELNLWENGLLADEHFFDVFTFPLLGGDKTTALAQTNSIVLTQTLARKLFRDENPIGRTVRYQREEDAYSVTGVMADVPANSSIQFTFIISASSNEDGYGYDMGENAWSNNAWQTFFVLAEGHDGATFEAKMPALVQKYAAGEDYDPETSNQYIVQALRDVHLSSRYNFDIGGQGNISSVYLFFAIGLVILLLACVNYTNLAVARSVKRAQEVGMRKVVGAIRGQLLGQFLGESLLMAFLALVLALGLVHLLLPFFGHLVERPIQMDYLGDGLLLPGLLALVGLVGLLSGSYPAFFMASLRPIQVLTGQDKLISRFRVQRLLIVGQYAVSIALVAGSFVVYEQMQYVQQKELGYDREHVVTIPIRDGALHQNYETVRDAWLRYPHVLAVTSSEWLPTNIESRTRIRYADGRDGSLAIYKTGAAYDFLDVFAIELEAGRTFSREIASDVENASIVNETAAYALGWTPKEAVGKHFIWNDVERIVIGVMRDFHMHSMHLTVEPLMVHFEPRGMRYMAVKVRPDDMPGTIALLERTVRQFTPYPFEYQFLDERFDQLYKAELRLGETVGFFTILALLIASLGLFGLAAFAAEQRTKEIGVRKVLGAKVTSLVAILSLDFLRLVGIAFVVGAPLAYLIMRRWLEDFAYHIELGPGIFLLAGGAALIIALATVSFQAIKAATADPIKSLRYE